MNVPDHPAREITLPKLPAAASLGLLDELRGYPENLKPRGLCETLTGACRRMISGMPWRQDAPLVREAAGMAEYLPPPLPSRLYTRDTMCWIP